MYYFARVIYDAGVILLFIIVVHIECSVDGTD